MPDVFLRRQSTSQLRFSHPFISGWIFAAIGSGILYYGLEHADSTAARWWSIAIGAPFAAIGIGGALWRYDLTIDLMARSYRGRRGFWPQPRTLQGSLDDLGGVLLNRTWRRGDNTEHAVWVVSLDFRGWEKPISVYETTSETKGYRKLEELARTLHTSAIDRTGETETVRAVDDLNRSLAERETGRGAASVHTIETPPPGSRIEWTRTDTGAPMIVLPALGFNLGSIFLALFGTPFLLFGALALASALGWSGVEVQGTPAAKWIVGGVFVLIGVIFWAGTVFGAVAREVIREDGDALLVTLLAFGRHYRRRRLARRDIEEIAIKPTRSSRSRRNSGPVKTEVVLRTDPEVVRIGGDLEPEGQQWLARTLLALARR